MASRQIRRVIGKVDGFVELAVRRLQLRCFQAFASGSPVKSGFFRAGWSPAAGAADRSGPTNRPKDLGLAAQQASALFSQHAQAAAALAVSYRLASGAVFIVNNVRYGVFLNGGSSAQAPAMFVELGIATAVRATARELSARS